MRKRRRTETVIEAHQILIFKQSENAPRLWCAECATQESLMVTPEEAAAFGYLGLRAICRLIEAGRIHYVETPEGRLLVCLNSLVAGNY